MAYTIAKNRNRFDEIGTYMIAALVLIATSSGILIPGFYDGVIDPRYATGTITTDLISMLCVPLLLVCIGFNRKGRVVAKIAWISLLAYIGYAYAVYAFDRMYTVLFPVYMIIFGLSSFVVVSILTCLDINHTAQYASDLPLRRVTAVFLIFTGLILYVIELPIILSRIPGDIQAGGTPFMVLDLSLVAPIAIMTGFWLWKQSPLGVVFTAIFLIKAITIMTSFLIADYIDWFAGRLTTHGATIAFTVVYFLVYFFTWNYFLTFNKKDRLNIKAV